ncbi:MAG: hypothetical protein JXQ69_03870 [Paludibacteraceae bacterium]|nr:hypothetical protein [Paludibacteraceae bacterium]MBN2787443.1 hypothetical protein [Paludibacteraceae bacterium]
MKEKMFFDEKPFFLRNETVTLKENQVFVILPFKNTLVFEKIIKPVLLSVGFTCIKADDIFNTGALMQDIADSIRESAVIITDLTGKNANVFYELGIAHAFNKRVILLTQNEDDVPSDLKGYRYYEYNICSTDGIAKFEDILRKLKESIDLSLIVNNEFEEKTFDISSEKGNELQINSDFLKQEEGAFVIWAYLNDKLIHPLKTGKEFTYIASHSTNNGNRAKLKITDLDNNEKEIDIYPNLWAIGRAANENDVIWRFVFNNGNSEHHLKSKIKLEVGWHMFSVVWSKDKDFIKFYIDSKCEDQTNYKFWPTELDKHVYLGTWPNRAKVHYFDSKIGNLIIHKNAIAFEKVNDYFKKIPK